MYICMYVHYIHMCPCPWLKLPREGDNRALVRGPGKVCGMPTRILFFIFFTFVIKMGHLILKPPPPTPLSHPSRSGVVMDLGQGGK